ncbi:DNA recombination protein RmuC [Kiloniella laminariae]|uniref:DNA recombination protein RmuC homolog n=1 Tax=Kiloniella laminariae TaxID=454162 RepID=A0ABT4LKF8_9PROT|nr:DNA recombination protein RmuC [Kiloniella laminariae]MCZ4281589.1 DNA recombination protein RmuC [Kiloniella laminariae]
MDLTTLLLGGLVGLTITALISLVFILKNRSTISELQTENRSLTKRQDELLLERIQQAELFTKLADDREELRETLTDVASRAAAEEQKATRIPELLEKQQQLETELANKREIIARLENRDAESRTTLQKEREAQTEKLQILDEARQKLTEQFENLANRILEEKSRKFTEQNKQGLEVLLNPLKENIVSFQKKVEETYDKESKERFSLHREVERLAQLNKQVSEDTHNLTRALKGQSQTQGAWGEMILEMVLEKSGLTKGREYSVQQSMHNEEGKRYRPDVVVHMPNGKDIVIDSKVSLTAYERLHSADDDTQSTTYLAEHIVSIQNHVRDLSRKSYHELDGIRSLDYVLLFMPIEGAFSIAVQQQPDLVGQALEKNVVIVTPSTLLLALRTVENIWRYEDQNQNAQKIANSAGKLYDKFVGFAEDLNKVGDFIGKAQKSHGDALNKLKDGTGNILRRVDQLQKMGAKTSKSLPANLTEFLEGDTDETDDIADSNKDHLSLLSHEDT